MPVTTKKKVLLYAGSLKPNGITTAYFSMLRHLDTDACDYYISYRSPSLKEHPERLNGMPEGYHYYPLATEMNLDVLTAVAQILYLNGGSLLLASGNGLRKHTAGNGRNISETQPLTRSFTMTATRIT